MNNDGSTLDSSTVYAKRRTTEDSLLLRTQYTDRILHEECSVLPPAGYKLRYVKVRSDTPREPESKLQTLNTIEPHDVTSEGNPQLHTEVALMLFVE